MSTPIGSHEWNRLVQSENSGVDDPTTQHVALAIACFADGETGEDVFPGIELLAKRCRRGQSTVRRHLQVLIKLGYLHVVRRGTGMTKTATVYRLTRPPVTANERAVSSSSHASANESALPPTVDDLSAQNVPGNRSQASDHQSVPTITNHRRARRARSAAGTSRGAPEIDSKNDKLRTAAENIQRATGFPKGKAITALRLLNFTDPKNYVETALANGDGDKLVEYLRNQLPTPIPPPYVPPEGVVKDINAS